VKKEDKGGNREKNGKSVRKGFRGSGEKRKIQPEINWVLQEMVTDLPGATQDS